MSKNQALQRAIELFRQAYEYQMKGELESAEEHYKRSIETFPTSEAYTFLGWTYSFQGKYEEAIEECKKAILMDPDFGNPYNDIGAYLIELGRYDEAIPWLERAIGAKRYETHHFPYFNLGRVYIAKEMYSEALRSFEKVLEMHPSHIAARQAVEQLKKQIQ